MIGWLKGERIEAWCNGTRSGVTISCSGIGYEVQILSRDQEKINSSKELILWVHQVQREDGSVLIGFIEKLDRNFFRKLISVNGIGTQLAISLLEKKGAYELIYAITNRDIKSLTSCPGIGNRIAERLVIELQSNLEEFMASIKPFENKTVFSNRSEGEDISSEVHSALINLGYGESEISNAFSELELESFKNNKDPHKSKMSEKLDFDGLFRETLLRINTEPRNKAT